MDTRAASAQTGAFPASHKRWDIFLAAGIRQPGCRERNERLIRVAESAGLSVFSPARESPPELSLTPLQILNQNRSAIASAPIFLFVPDGAGVGVFYELGLAEALGKTIVGYSELGVEGLGKVVEGWWAALPDNRRATNHASLQTILINLRNSPYDKKTKFTHSPAISPHPGRPSRRQPG